MAKSIPFTLCLYILSFKSSEIIYRNYPFRHVYYVTQGRNLAVLRNVQKLTNKRNLLSSFRKIILIPFEPYEKSMVLFLLY